jgi:equilibrative nucleoside transporter 1/2/3
MGDDRKFADLPADEKHLPEKDELLAEHKCRQLSGDGHYKKRKSLLDSGDVDLEIVVRPTDQEKLPVVISELKADEVPKDRYYLVYMIFLMHGVAVLMPWNMFITANSYFEKHKFAPSANGTDDDPATWYREYFLNSVTFVAQVPNILLNGINLFCQVGSGGSTAKRITWSIIIIVIVFIFTVVLAMVDSSSWPAAFFWITMASVVVINSANGMYQNSVYGLAACLPMKYTNAVVLGSNTSGAITAVISLISLATAPDLRTSAIYYFLTAVFVLLIAFDTFFALPMIPFFKYYSKKAEAEKQRANEESGTKNYLAVYYEVFKKTWKADLCVFFVFFVTLTCFPAIQAGVARSSCDFILGDEFFTIVTCFLFFNVFAMLGSLSTMFVQWPGPRWAWIPILLRVLFIPFLMFCNFKPTKRGLPVLIPNDYVYCAGGILMAFTGGYFSSLSMMFAPRNVDDRHKGVAGMMAAFSLIVGIFVGIIFSFPVTAFIENVGSFQYSALVCPSDGDLTAIVHLGLTNHSQIFEQNFTGAIPL